MATLPTVTPIAICDAGWTQWGTSCYKLETTVVSAHQIGCYFLKCWENYRNTPILFIVYNITDINYYFVALLLWNIILLHDILLQKSWDDARTVCVCTESADLVDVQSAAEDGFLQALTGGTAAIWLGNNYYCLFSAE